MLAPTFGKSLPSLDDCAFQDHEEDLVHIPRGIMQAPVINPADFCLQMSHTERRLFDHRKGTTTLAFIFKQGAMVAVDSRASMGSYGSSRTVEKILDLNERMIATLAGTAADCQYWLAWLTMQLKLFEFKNGRKPSVACASKICVNLISYYKQYNLQMGLTLIGYDQKGPSIYYIDTDGSRIKTNLTSCGSGSPHAFGVIDSFYRYDLNLDQASDLAIRAITHATYRDAGSAGMARAKFVSKEGHRWIERGKAVDEIFRNIQKAKGQAEDQSTYL